MGVTIMSNVNRANRKLEDDDIIRMNSFGISLKTIGKLAGCHPTTITLRLKAMGVPPADTRRAFIEYIFVTLTPNQQEWLADQLGPHITVKDFVKNLLVQAYMKSDS